MSANASSDDEINDERHLNPSQRDLLQQMSEEFYKTLL